MRTDEKLTDLPFFNVFKIVDPDMHLKNYLYGERRGKDSVAFVIHKRDTEFFIVNHEFKPPVNEFIIGGFGGSIDKDKSHENIVIDEVKEEAGFTVDASDVFSVGKVLVSTQMNQFCHLYIVLVNDDQLTGREPENAVEAMAAPTISTYDHLINYEDWKPVTIIQRAVKRGIISSDVVKVTVPF